jgi:hypothetical protein
MMRNTTKIGLFFIGIAAILQISRNITAAILVSHMSTPQAQYFESGYDIVGKGYLFWPILSLLIGITFVIIGQMDEMKAVITKFSKMSNSNEK